MKTIFLKFIILGFSLVHLWAGGVAGPGKFKGFLLGPKPPIPHEEWSKDPSIAVKEVFEDVVREGKQPNSWLGDFFQNNPTPIMREQAELALLTALTTYKHRYPSWYLLNNTLTIPEVIANIRSNNPKIIELLLVLAEDYASQDREARAHYRVAALKALANNQVTDPKIHERLAYLITSEVDTVTALDLRDKERKKDYQEIEKARKKGFWRGVFKEVSISTKWDQRPVLTGVDSWGVLEAIEQALLTDKLSLLVSAEIKTKVQQAMSQIKPHYKYYYQYSHKSYLNMAERIRSYFRCRTAFSSQYTTVN